MTAWTGRVSFWGLWLRSSSFFFLWVLLMLPALLTGGFTSVEASPLSRSVAVDLNILADCIGEAESGNVPHRDGATRLEKMAVCKGTLDGGECDEPLQYIYTIAHGRYQITTVVLNHWFPGVDSSWLHHPLKAREIVLKILARLRDWYPHGEARRLAYAYTAGWNAKPYRQKNKREYADRVAVCYRERTR